MPDSEYSSQIARFIANLEELDAGERARLKRNAGKTLPEAHNVLGLFYQTLLNGVYIRESQEEIYFLVATLFPFEKQVNEPPPRLPFARAMQQIRMAELKKRNAKEKKQKLSLDTRMERLLDADSQQLPYYLRREVMFVTNAGKCIQWDTLLKDLLGWNHPARYVQCRWAREYFGALEEPEEDEQESN